ncbi:MAG: PAS domain S-box protein [Nitrospira sp. NTP2]|nr:PAS domain S-box protein [Nitrospira sp. NTP2]RIK57626.1 MAG: hypothetical protein DCC63_13390 [Nitrospira sp.]
MIPAHLTLQRVAGFAALAAIAVPLLILLSWAYEASWLTAVHPSFGTIKPITLLSILLCGFSLWLLSDEGAVTVTGRRAAQAGAGLACLLAGLTLAEYLFAVDVGIDLWFLEGRDIDSSAHPGRMAPSTAIVSLLLGLALLSLDHPLSNGHYPSQYAALLGGTIGGIALVGYLYGVRSLYKVGSFATISMYSATLMFLIGLGILASRPMRGFMATLMSEDLGGVMLRQVLPFAVFLPILAGWIRITAQRSGYYEFNFGVALAVAAVMLIMLTLLWFLAAHLNRTDGQKKHILQILQQREARHRLALKAGRMGTFHQDLDQQTLMFSPELEAMFGLLPMSFGSTFAAFLALVHSEDKQRVERTVEEAIRNRSAYEFECRVHRALPPSEAWIAVVAQVLPDTSGSPRQITGVMFDVTERKRSETALRESEERFRHLFEQASDGIVMADMTGQYLDVNSRACHMLGYSRDELLSMKIADLFAPHEQSRLSEILMELLEGQRHSGEWRLQRKDGTAISVEMSAKLQPDGRWHAILRDITERKRAEAGLRESEAHFRMLADATPVLVWMAGADRLRTWLNRSWIEYTGRDLEDELGDGWAEGIHPDDRATALARYRSHFGRLEPFELEYRLRRHDGRYGWILDRAVPLTTADGSITGYLGAALDITDRKHAEEQLQQWTGELEQRVHERTEALVRSQARLRALALDLSATEQQERRRLATELHDYLAQLLVVARMKLGQAKPQAREPKLQQLLNDADDVLTQSLNYTRSLVAELSPQVLYQFGLPAALKWLAGQMKTHGLAVTVTTALDRLPLEEDHAVIMYQSVRELLFNVVKHAGTDEASIVLSRSVDDLIVVTVSDRGRGFDPASMTEADRTSPGRFGLFNVQERIEAVGGRLALDSHEGRGTSITLMVPLSHAQDSAREMGSSRPTQPDSLPNPPSQRLRVLLVDDHAMVRQGLRSVLENYQDLEVVGEAGDGETAVSLAASLKPDVVVMDINMPRVDGIEATRRILSSDHTVVVIGLSVQNEHHVEEAMLAAGAAVFVTKERAAVQLYEAIVSTVRART